MADKPEDDTPAPAKKKKGKKKLIVMLLALVVLIGGGVGGGLYVAKAGPFAGSDGAVATTDNQPHLVPKSEEKRISGAEGESGDGHGSPTPAGSGGDKYASTYYAMDKEFTSNLQNSVHFVQIGLAVSTPYDERVIDNLKTHEIAVRSAILMTLGDTSEDEVFTSDGKRHLQVETGPIDQRRAQTKRRIRRRW